MSFLIEYRYICENTLQPKKHKQTRPCTKFAKSMNFLKTITPHLRMGGRSYAYRLTPFNAAMSYIMRRGISGSGLDLTVGYDRVLVARGSSMPALNATATSTGVRLASLGPTTAAWATHWAVT